MNISSSEATAGPQLLDPSAARRGSALWEAIEARNVIEQALARLAALRRTERDGAQLGDAVARMRAAADDPAAFSAGDFAFHVVLSEAAHNDLLAGRLAALRHQVQEMIELSTVAAFREGGVPALIDLHERLADAIRRGDADEAPQLVGEMMSWLRHEARYATPNHVYEPSTPRSAVHTKGEGA